MTPSNAPPAAARPRKETLLPQIKKLAREGLPVRAIAAWLGVPKTTIDRWLRAIQRQRAAKQVLDPAAVLRQKVDKPLVGKQAHHRSFPADRTSGRPEVRPAVFVL